MKHIYKWFFCILIFGCSSNDNNLLEDHSYRGGYIEFKEFPTVLNYNFLKIDAFKIESQLIDNNKNASKYSLVTFNENLGYKDAMLKGRAQDKAILNMLSDGIINLNDDLKTILEKVKHETSAILEDDRIAGLK